MVCIWGYNGNICISRLVAELVFIDGLKYLFKYQYLLGKRNRKWLDHILCYTPDKFNFWHTTVSPVVKVIGKNLKK